MKNVVIKEAFLKIKILLFIKVTLQRTSLNFFHNSRIKQSRSIT